MPLEDDIRGCVQLNVTSRSVSLAGQEQRNAILVLARGRVLEGSVKLFVLLVDFTAELDETLADLTISKDAKIEKLWNIYIIFQHILMFLDQMGNFES